MIKFQNLIVKFKIFQKCVIKFQNMCSKIQNVSKIVLTDHEKNTKNHGPSCSLLKEPK